MFDCYISEIRLFAFGFAPRGWLLCNGQSLLVKDYKDLFSILKTTYGGDGITTFKLPDLSARAVLGSGDEYPRGQTGGAAKHALTDKETPLHTHQAYTSGNAANASTPLNNFWPASGGANAYGNKLDVQMKDPLSKVGESHPHENMQPYLTLNYCIAFYGTYPDRS